jgi:hypothetical protein
MALTTVPSTMFTAGQTPAFNGVAFPATQSASADANTLDDYEEGTFTPSYSGDGGSFSTLTYSIRTGVYTKIGDTVYFSINIFTSNVSLGTASGSLRITGLPFAARTDSQLHPAIAIGRAYRFGYSVTKMRAYINAGETSISFANMDENAAFATNPPVGTLATGANSYYNGIDVSGSYKIA